MTSFEEALNVSIQVRGAYQDKVAAMSGAQAAHAHEHLVLHLQKVAMYAASQTSVQCLFLLQVFELLMIRVLGDPPDMSGQATRDCAHADQFVLEVVTVMAGAMGSEVARGSEGRADGAGGGAG